MLKDLFKGSAIYGLAPFVPRIITVLVLPILTKYLTSVDYGIIGTITAIAFAVQALQDLGLRVLLTNYFFKSRTHYKIIWREIYGFLSLWMIVYAILQSTLLYIFIPQEAESNKWLIIIMSNITTVFFGPTAMIGQTYYQLNLKPEPVAWRIVLAGLLTVLLNYLCVVVFRWGYMGAFVGTFAGTFVTNLTYWPVVNRKLSLSPIFNFKIRTIKRLLKISLPMIPHYYTGYLMNSTNVVAMNYHGKSQSEIGHLTMAQNFSGMFETALNAVNQVVSPMSFQYIRDKNIKELKRLIYTYIFITYSLTFLYSLWAKEIYSILISNAEIAATYKYSVILVMALNYRPFYVYCSNYLFYHEQTLNLLGITLVSGIISSIFYFTMIPYMGIYAALIGFYIGCLYFGYSGYLQKIYRRETIYKLKWYLYIMLQIVLSFVVFYLVDRSFVIKIISSIIYVSIMGTFFLKKSIVH